MGGVETWQVYGIGGELIAEYAGNAPASNPQKEYGYRNGQLLITAEVAAAAAVIPLNLTAGPSPGNPANTISLGWAGVSGAAYYRVERKAATGAFAPIAWPTEPSLTDSTAATATAYLYKVCTAAASNGDCTSEYSNLALGARFTFPTDATIVSMLDDPTGATATPIKAAHITELRTMVNAVRSLAGMSAATWTHPNLAAGDLIYKDDVKDLRDKLNEALTNLGIRTANWEDAILAGAPNGTPIRANHIRQLRARATSGSGANSCYKSIDQFVKDFYQGVLHRQPDSTELTQWTESLTTAQNEGHSELMDEAQNLGATLFSPNLYGSSTSNEQFITDLFTGYLHRQPNDPPDGNWEGYNFWLNHLNTPGIVRANLIEAFATSIEFHQHVSALCVTSAGGGNIHWLVPDQLGTPRMVFDQTGSLAATSRHDYLPFGEELADSVGLRSGHGYNDADGARMKFTSKERDGETGLDYFGARYYASIQGRFTSPDPEGPSLTEPQSMNKYRYALNNPFRYIDPDGGYEIDVHNWLTKALAYGAGFSMEQATQIALANNGLDKEGSSTDPMPPGNFEARALWHFTTTQRRAQVWKTFSDYATTGYFGPSLSDLGRYLHVWQDHFSHGTRSPIDGQVPDCFTSGWFKEEDCHKPDKTYEHADTADEMASTTFDKLTKAISIYRGTQRGGPFSKFTAAVSYSLISPLVSQFNRERDLTKKSVIIGQIIDTIRRERQRLSREGVQRAYSLPSGGHDGAGQGMAIYLTRFE